VAAVARELRDVGVPVYLSPDDCVPDAVAILTNALSSGPRQKVLQNERVTARQGIIGCEVLKEAPPRTKDQPRTIIEAPAVIGSGTEFMVGNVVCTIYPLNGNKAGQVARLRRALEALTRSEAPA
jgi:hypothetical protein